MSAMPFDQAGVDADDVLLFDELWDDSLFRVLKKNRGWTEEYLAEINDPSHDELQNVDAMIAELRRFRTSNECIVVLPDFDMDGIASGVIAWAGLSELGFNVQLYIPNYGRGHDITPETIRECGISIRPSQRSSQRTLASTVAQGSPKRDVLESARSSRITTWNLPRGATPTSRSTPLASARRTPILGSAERT